MLTIYKASAGSGKTFRLVAEYLKLVLQNEFNYRHILGVTFTNKATAEMKSRVISQLNRIAHGDGNDLLTKLIADETRIPPEEIRSRATKILQNILYDYSRFSISTIDKFTQRVIKSFNREIGIAPGYTLELDNDLILQEATDRLILRSGNDKKLLKWMARLGNDQIADSRSFDIRKEILNLGKELFNERFQEFFISGQKDFYSHKKLKTFRIQLRKITQKFEADLKEKGELGLTIMGEYGLSVSDFSYKEAGIASAFSKVANKSFVFGKRISEDSADPEKWVGKQHPQRALILSAVENKLLPLLQEILEYIGRNYAMYSTAEIVKSNLYTLGLLDHLQEEIALIRQEKGILPISDSNLLLKKIIDGSDSPFIYEKTGNVYSHFMLDEFQDTSALQWANFKPLIGNSLAEGKSNLVVGDVKQSIYRWRNGDWNILASEIESEFDNDRFRIKSLANNWRSKTNIVEFNNIVFPGMAKQVATLAGDNPENEIAGDPGNSELIQKIYGDVVQTVENTHEKKGGFARINFIKNSEEPGFSEQSLQRLLEQVKQLRDAGFSGNEIAILVRRNQEGGEVIRYFMEAAEWPENKDYNLAIISNESLFLNSSNSVVLVASVMSHFVNPDDKIVRATILNEYKNFIFPILSAIGKEPVYNGRFPGETASLQPGLSPGFEEEFEKYFAPVIAKVKISVLNASIDEVITTVCRAFNLFEIEGDLPFIQGLIDQAAQVKTGLSNDLSNFIKWWEEKGAKLSVNVNDETNAIRLLTIHKSKGLEFRAVLLPFFDWPMKWSHTPLIWCHSDAEPFNLLPLIPMKAFNIMQHTIFKGDYNKELFETYIDNLNLVYVAFTRAIEVLFVNARLQEKGNSVAELLFSSLQQAGQGSWDEEGMCFTFGEMPGITTEEPKEKLNLPVAGYVFNEFHSRLKLRTSRDTFFPDGSLSDKNLGTLVHEILSGIETAGDVEKVCNQALQLQKITKSEFDSLVRWLGELTFSPQAREWFSGKYSVLNERNILSPEGIKRPDRVMMEAGKVVVVDYKIGEPMPGKYNRQVASYVSELKKAGFENVEGFLWYLVPNIVEKVGEQ